MICICCRRVCLSFVTCFYWWTDDFFAENDQLLRSLVDQYEETLDAVVALDTEILEICFV